jgi:hypothetical protein
MKIVVPALTAAFLATIGASSAAQAAVIDFSGAALCPIGCTGISYTGATLRDSTAVDLDGSTWIVTRVNTGDASGLGGGSAFTISPTTATYGALSGLVNVDLTTDIIKEWDGTFGHFKETLNKLVEVDRGLDSIAFVLSGFVTGGAFTDSPVTMQFSLTQAGGPGNVVSASLTNAGATAAPEPATWVMMGLGFVGLGYAAVRRGSKDRSAVVMV